RLQSLQSLTASQVTQNERNAYSQRQLQQDADDDDILPLLTPRPQNSVHRSTEADDHRIVRKTIDRHDPIGVVQRTDVGHRPMTDSLRQHPVGGRIWCCSNNSRDGGLANKQNPAKIEHRYDRVGLRCNLGEEGLEIRKIYLAQKDTQEFPAGRTDPTSDVD